MSVTISYFDPLGVAPNIIKDIEARVPLLNLHWHSPPRPLRAIAALPVRLVEETIASSETGSGVAGLLEAPYMKIMLVKCDDNDTYRSSVRKIIREWFTTKVVARRDSTEWMIFYYGPRTATSSALRFKTGVFDKIKADFNTSSKEDRCVYVPSTFASDVDELDLWGDVMMRLKDGVLDAFGRRVRLYEAEVRQLEATPAWAGFFAMKERLAHAFDSLHLVEDALGEYDELAAAAAGAARGPPPPAGRATAVGGSPLAYTPAEFAALRGKVLDGAATGYDLRCYLFGRQAALLLALMAAASSPTMAAIRVAELLVRTRDFVLDAAKLADVDQYTAAAWQFAVIVDVLDATEHQGLAGGKTRDVADSRAEVLLLARAAVETLAEQRGWAVADGVAGLTGALAEVDLDGPAAVPAPAPPLSGRLADVLASRQAFLDFYLDISDTARSYYESADRTRSVDKLRTDMAVVLHANGDYDGAVKLLTSLPQIYASQGWAAISTSLYLVYGDCLRRLGRAEEYLKINMHLLRARPDLVDMAELCASVRAMAADLPRQVRVDADAVFGLAVAGVARPGAAGCALDLHVHNAFDSTWDVDSVVVRLADAAGQTLEFAAGATVVEPGDNTVALRTAVTTPGDFGVVAVELVLGQLVLVEPAPEGRVRTYARPDALAVELRAPRELRLAGGRTLELDVVAGADAAQAVAVRARPATAGLTLDLAEASVQVATAAAEPAAADGDTVVLGDLAAGACARVVLPYALTADADDVDVAVEVDYRTAAGAQTLARVLRASVALPVAVSVQDIFKADVLFSKFSVGCTAVPLRVLAGRLEGTAEFAVTGGGTADEHVALATQPVALTYAIARQTTGPRPGAALPLELALDYRRLDDEVAAVVRAAAAAAVAAEPGAGPYAGLVAEAALAAVPRAVDAYALGGPVDLGAYDARDWARVLAVAGADGGRGAVEAVARVLHGGPLAPEDAAATAATRRVAVPVEIPAVDVLFTIELAAAGGPGPLGASVFHIGQEIAIRLRIEATHAWAARATPDGAEFVYDVLAHPASWLISGKRKGHFRATERRLDVALVLVPLKPGTVLLPAVEVRTAPGVDVVAEVDYVNNAESIVVLPEMTHVMFAVD
ncbi:trafficking protein particle complex subunit 10 [Dipodascopsis tothii]|uniref:trafficking protein particle complex subunit 10 n=1 Tax=Dipodascopsis tothii TaxID=44089 RepID=UPI0034CE5F4E